MFGCCCEDELSDRLRKPGNCTPLPLLDEGDEAKELSSKRLILVDELLVCSADAGSTYGRSRGEWAGVASGVWSGVGLRESCEGANEGELGAVDCGEI